MWYTNNMFNLSHILFMIFSLIGLVATFILCKLLIKSQKWKDMILKIAAILTVVLHYSPLYVGFFTTGVAEVYETMLFPLYPCNIAMWLLVIVAFWKNKQSKTFRVMATMLFYLGVIGGTVGIVFNEIYGNNPTLASWHVLHGLLSHVTLLLGSIWLVVGGYFKIRVKNIFSIAFGLLGMVIIGWSMIGLYKLFGQEPVNCMFLLESPIPSMPFINTYLIGVGALAILFVITAVYEQIALKKEDRWYTLLKKRSK